MAKRKVGDPRNLKPISKATKDFLKYYDFDAHYDIFNRIPSHVIAYLISTNDQVVEHQEELFVYYCNRFNYQYAKEDHDIYTRMYYMAEHGVMVGKATNILKDCGRSLANNTRLENGESIQQVPLMVGSEMAILSYYTSSLHCAKDKSAHPTFKQYAAAWVFADLPGTNANSTIKEQLKAKYGCERWSTLKPGHSIVNC